MISTLLVNSIIVGFVAGSLCGCTGTICGRMRLSTIAFSMAHAALAGSALSLLLGWNYLITGMLFAILTAIILGPLSDILRISLDTASMTLFSIYNALTFIFLIMSPGPTLSSEKVGGILWGSILAITPAYLIILMTISIIYLMILQIFWGRISSILFDPRLAEAEGVNVKFYTYMLLVLAGMIIVFTLKITGGFLVFSLLFIPSATSIQISKSLKGMIFTSSIIGGLSSTIGILMSFILNLPVGSCIVIGAATIFAATSIASLIIKSRITEGESIEIGS
ncbi:MAG: hypothetical protein DRJ43_02230 [Thermoprotei archaeon]|nr:MAG: hypothetical protein DRJ43_02230 [Thermoprotei archaeon]